MTIAEMIRRLEAIALVYGNQTPVWIDSDPMHVATEVQVETEWHSGSAFEYPPVFVCIC